MSIHPTFANPETQALFQKQGYVILPMLDRSEIPGILQDFQGLRPADGYQGMQETELPAQSFHVTFFDSDHDYRNQVFEKVKALFQDWVTEHLVDHRMVQGNVFLKPPGKGFVFPHQNLTITFEDDFRSVSLWCPLQDTGPENGTLYVIPGSHQGFMYYRNTQILWPLWESFMPGGKATSYLLPLNVKAGEVVVLDDALIHVTPDNLSEAPRWVLHALWLPERAPLLYCDLERDMISEYAVPEDFWQHYIPGTTPTLQELIGCGPYDEPQYTEEELIAKLEELRREQS